MQHGDVFGTLILKLRSNKGREHKGWQPAGPVGGGPTLAVCGSRGGGGGPDPPEKSQKYRVSSQYWSGSPEKSQSYQASIQCWANIPRPVKCHLNGSRPSSAFQQNAI